MSPGTESSLPTVSSPAPETVALREDAWLADLLGRPAWRVGSAASIDSATAALADLDGPCFCDARVDCADVGRTNALEAAGMRVVSTSLELSLTPHETLADPAGVEVRRADPDRDQAVGDIAG